MAEFWIFASAKVEFLIVALIIICFTIYNIFELVIEGPQCEKNSIELIYESECDEDCSTCKCGHEEKQTNTLSDKKD